MKLSTLKRICDYFDLEIKQEEPNVFSIDQFTIYESDKPVLIETITGTTDSGRKQWLIDEEVAYSGNREEPDGSDTHTLPAENNLASAVYTVIKRIQTQELDHVFQSEAECEFHEEEEYSV
jgi:hypothetical protein